MSHLAIFEYQWEQKSFLDWPHSSKECSGMQLGIEEIRYVWTHQREFNHHQSTWGPRGRTPHCAPYWLWHVLFMFYWASNIWWSMSLHVIALLRLGCWSVSKEPRTEQSFMSDKTDRIASQVEKEEGETEEESTGNGEGNVAKKVIGQGTKRHLSGEGMTRPFFLPGTQRCPQWSLDVLQPCVPWFHFILFHLPSTEWIWDLVASYSLY